MELALSVVGPYDLPLTSGIKQRWWDVHGYLYIIMLHKIITLSREDTLSLDGFEEICCHVISHHMALAMWQGTQDSLELERNWSLQCSRLQKLNVANNHRNLKADTSPVEPSGDTPTQADNLLAAYETLRQKIQLWLRIMTHRNCEIINVCSCTPWSFHCYTVIVNAIMLFLEITIFFIFYSLFNSY